MTDREKDLAAVAMLREEIRLIQSAIRPRPDTWTPGDQALYQVHHQTAQRLELLFHAIARILEPWQDPDDQDEETPALRDEHLSNDARLFLTYQPRRVGERAGITFYADPSNPDEGCLVAILPTGKLNWTTFQTLPRTDAEARNPAAY